MYKNTMSLITQNSSNMLIFKNTTTTFFRISFKSISIASILTILNFII